ncbi:hypothetical protein GCM10010488_04730 [Oerskovia jenensis]
MGDQEGSRGAVLTCAKRGLDHALIRVQAKRQWPVDHLRVTPDRIEGCEVDPHVLRDRVEDVERDRCPGAARSPRVRFPAWPCCLDRASSMSFASVRAWTGSRLTLR